MVTVSGRDDTGLNDATPSVDSVKRAFAILNSFDVDHSEWGVSELAASLHMHKSTVHRLLVTLEREHIAYQTPTGRYALTWRLMSVLGAIQPRRSVRKVIVDELRRLAEQTSETAQLGVREGSYVLYIEKVEGSRMLQMPSSVGSRLPLHCTALGKVLLSDLPLQSTRKLLYGNSLEAMTSKTITDPGLLIEALAEVRKDAFAVDDEEIEEGLMCMAAPIRNPEGVVRASVSIAGSTARFHAYRPQYVSAVKGCAERLSSILGSQVDQFFKGDDERAGSSD